MAKRLAVPPWFYGEFVGYVQRVVPIPNWPEVGTEEGEDFWDAIGNVLRRRGATEDQAMEAASRLAGSPPKFPNQFNTPFFAELSDVFDEAIKAQAVAAPDGKAVTERGAAEMASRGCLDCAGAGFAHRYTHAVTESPTHEGRVYPAGTAWVLYCTCPLGQYLAAKQDESAIRRTANLRDFPRLQMRPAPWWPDREPDCRHRYRPDDWDAARNRPSAHMLGMAAMGLAGIVAGGGLKSVGRMPDRASRGDAPSSIPAPAGLATSRSGEDPPF